MPKWVMFCLHLRLRSCTFAPSLCAAQTHCICGVNCVMVSSHLGLAPIYFDSEQSAVNGALGHIPDVLDNVG